MLALILEKMAKGIRVKLHPIKEVIITNYISAFLRWQRVLTN